MKVLILLSFVAAVCAYSVPENDPPYSIIAEELIPLGDKIREVEERMATNRIIGGLPAVPGQVPYQAGLLASYQDIAGTGVCGGSLVSVDKVITAAHCWFDGLNQAWVFTVVLGSVTLFSGGHRTNTSTVVMHPQWSPNLIRNDVAVIYLPDPVPLSNTISPIALPSDNELGELFSGVVALASGFGLTSDDGNILINQTLHQVSLRTISNTVCSLSFPIIVQQSNICTSSTGGASTCRGDSGGPLVTVTSGRPLLIGITSFGSARGCEVGSAAVYARVTSFIDFFRQHL